MTVERFVKDIDKIAKPLFPPIWKEQFFSVHLFVQFEFVSIAHFGE